MDWDDITAFRPQWAEVQSDGSVDSWEGLAENSLQISERDFANRFGESGFNPNDGPGDVGSEIFREETPTTPYPGREGVNTIPKEWIYGRNKK